MKLLLTIILCTPYVFGLNLNEYRNDEHLIDYRLTPFFRNVLNEVNCVRPGLTCSNDCRSVHLCIEGSNGFESIIAETCKTPETCNNGECSDTPSIECSPVLKAEFLCGNLEGMYPDPFNCKKFHYCTPGQNSNLQHVESSCKDNKWQYNPRTTYCDIHLSNNACPAGYPVPVCRQLGDHGALAENPSIYYICLKYKDQDYLYPHLRRCDNGFVYDGNYGCEAAPSPSP